MSLVKPRFKVDPRMTRLRHESVGEAAAVAAAAPAGTTAASGASGVPGAHGEPRVSLAMGNPSAKGAQETPTDLSGATSAAADAAELEAAFEAVVAAAAKTFTVSSTAGWQTNKKNCSARDADANLSISSTGASSTALREACSSFFLKVSKAFRLNNTREANGVVYVHRTSGAGGKLFVDRQQLLRLRGHQQKGNWSLHFLGTGAMQASASRATSSILFSRGDGSAWLFDCGGGLSPTHATSVSRKNAPEAAATAAIAAAATAGLTSRLQHAVALAVAAESIAREESDELHQQQPRRVRPHTSRRVGVVQRVFVTHLHGDHCLGIPAFLAQIAQDPDQAPSEVAGRPDLELNADGSYDVFEDAGIHVKAAPIRHLVPCVGYVISEKRSRLPLRADLLDPIIARNAQELADMNKWPQLRGEPKAIYKLPLLELKPAHCPPSWWLALLTKMAHTGKPFIFPDGSMVGPSDVFAEALEPRKFCIAFDTCDASRLIPFARGCDVLVHEATMSGVKGTSSKADDSVDPLPPAIKSKCLPGEDSSAAAEARITAKDLMEPHVRAASAAAFERGHASAAMAGSVLTMERVEEEAR
ncbi:hypothetical protein Emag_000503 [Eimeria magna]